MEFGFVTVWRARAWWGEQINFHYMPAVNYPGKTRVLWRGREGWPGEAFQVAITPSKNANSPRPLGAGKYRIK
jgi:hypothetical protein